MFRLPGVYSVPAISPAMKTGTRPAKWAPAGQPVLPGPADEYAFVGVSLDIENYCTVSLFFEQASPIAMRCTSALYGVFRGFCLIG